LISTEQRLTLHAVVASQVEDAVRQESSNDLGGLVRRPEPAEPLGEFAVGEEVAEVQDGVGDEAALDHAEQEPADVKAGPPRQRSLRRGDRAPADHLDRNPSIRSHLLADELRWKLGKQE
jgi:hypothetical protein